MKMVLTGGANPAAKHPTQAQRRNEQQCEGDGAGVDDAESTGVHDEVGGEKVDRNREQQKGYQHNVLADSLAERNGSVHACLSWLTNNKRK